MFRITEDLSSGTLVQCLPKNYKNEFIVPVDGHDRIIGKDVLLSHSITFKESERMWERSCCGLFEGRNLECSWKPRKLRMAELWAKTIPQI
jgi:hypothetical protein